ncbi:MAG: tetratricopeptide repeat protein [Acidobacteriota bacterium]
MLKRLSTILVSGVVLLTSAVAVRADWDAGVAAFKSGNYNEAAKQFQAFVDERPDVFQGHYMLGQSLAKLNRNQEALAHLKKAIELEPNNVGVQLILGKVYLEVGQYADAAAILGKIDSSSLPAAQQSAVHQMLALALEKSGDSGRALGQLAQAARAKPNDANVQYQYGAAALRAGDTATAVTALGKAASLEPNDPDKLNAYAQALVRVGRTSQGNAKTQAYQKAAQAGAQLVALDPSYDNLMLLAGAQLGAKQYDGALSTLQQAARKNPSDWLPLFYMGQAYTQKENYSSAERSLASATSKASTAKDKSTINSQLGFVYEKQKRYDEAIAAYRTAGDQSGVARAQKNKETAEFNKAVEEENEIRRQLQEEKEKLEEELKGLPGGTAPDDSGGD